MSAVSVEHHRAAAIEEDAIVEVMAHSLGQHAPLNVAAPADQILRRVPVGNRLHVLGDDRPLVEVRCHVMRRGANHLHAARMGLVIGPRALEARQEAVMNVDAAAREPG